MPISKVEERKVREAKSALVTALIQHRARLLGIASKNPKPVFPESTHTRYFSGTSIVTQLTPLTDEVIARYVDTLSDYTLPTEIGAEAFFGRMYEWHSPSNKPF
jgi:hypothetical protein